jgi:hypothetical protein
MHGYCLFISSSKEVTFILSLETNTPVSFIYKNIIIQKHPLRIPYC